MATSTSGVNVKNVSRKSSKSGRINMRLTLGDLFGSGTRALTRYTGTLLSVFVVQSLVAMAVMFAWVLIVFGVYGWVRSEKRRIGVMGALLGAALATLLDLAIEPVAFHLERYWEWLAPGPINYYAVPLANFAAWFVVAFCLLLLIDAVLFHVYRPSFSSIRLIALVPRLLYGTSLFMFGLVDLTHGYYGATLFALLAGLMVGGLALLERKKTYAHS